MSELDRDNAKSIDDEETDDIEEIEYEILVSTKTGLWHPQRVA